MVPAAWCDPNNPLLTLPLRQLRGAELRDHDTDETLFERADRALYRAKKDGRNRKPPWPPERHSRHNRRHHALSRSVVFAHS